jgi:hypothetical protein
MIKALFLIFDPANRWERIVEARRSLTFILFLYLVPMVVLSLMGELAGLILLGRHHPHSFGEIIRIPQNQAIRYGVVQFFLSLAMVFVSAQLISSVAQTFHGRNSFTQCFTLVAYSLGPLFLVHLADAFPFMSAWASFGVGITLSLCVLYNGLPRTLLPDPPHAFGLFMISAFVLAIVAGLARVLELLLLDRRILFS